MNGFVFDETVRSKQKETKRTGEYTINIPAHGAHGDDHANKEAPITGCRFFQPHPHRRFALSTAFELFQARNVALPFCRPHITTSESSGVDDDLCRSLCVRVSQLSGSHTPEDRFR